MNQFGQGGVSPQTRSRPAKSVEERRKKAIMQRWERETWLSGVIRGTIVEVKTLPDGRQVEHPASVLTRIKACELLARMQGELQGEAAITASTVAVTRIERVIIDGRAKTMTERGELIDVEPLAPSSAKELALA